MRRFVSIGEVPPVHRSEEHGGRGPIVFRRLLAGDDFATKIDFVDITTIPPGSTIGRHQHVDNEELYYIIAGTPLMRVDDEECRVGPGSVAVVRSGGTHELVNDTADPVQIFVFQVAS